MCKKHLLMIALMALFVPSALLGQEFNHLTYFTQTSTDDFKHGTPYMVDVADGTVSLQYRMASVAEWASTSNMPQNLKRHQMVTWRDYVYCVGGYNGSNPVNTVYRATQQTNGISGWSGLNAMPLALKDLAVVATQTSLIVMGGVNNEGASDKIYYAPFNNDGSIGAWTESEVTLPQPMYGMRAIQALGNIYLIGGTTVNGEEETLVKNVYLLKVDAHGEVTSITTTTSLPEVRGGHAVAFYDSKIYVTGGYDASQTAKSTVYSAAVNLNGTLGSWSTRTALPKALYDHTAVVSNGELVVMGGSDGSIASNAVYHTPLDATNLEWTLSDVFLTERLSQAVSFAFGNKIFFCGGEAISGVVNSNVNFMAVTTSDKPIRKTAFVGETFYVGAPKTLQQFNYTLNVGSGTSYEILYRTAGADKVFGNWTSKSANQPAAIGENKCYVQYMFRFTATASCTENLSLEEVTLVVNGCSQLAGNLNDVSTLTLAGSPYWVTESISFTNGTHNIEAGVVIYFRANTMLSITQASVNFNGTAANPILLTYEDVDEGMWDGVRFEDASDNGVSSVMNYTNIEKAGHGETRANLRLNYTNQPTMNHCTFNHSSVHGILMYNSSPAMTACAMNDNAENGLWLDNSAPNCTSCTLDGNGFAGIYHYNANFNAVFSGVTTSNNLYGLYSCTPNRSFTYEQEALSFVNNGSDIAMAGGQVGSDQTWNKFTNGYALLGNVEVYGGTPKLTVKPGAIIKVAQNYGFYVGRNGNQGGMLYAVGTASQPITFTALNGEVAGWEGVRFRDGSDYSSTSSMRYCLVEKATTNLVCENTNQPSVLWSTFQDARDQDVYLNNSNISIEGSTIKNSVKGLWVNSSSPTLVSVVFENHSEVCVYHNNTCNVTYSDCTLKDSYFGIRYETVERDMANNPNVVFENNYANIAMPGGHIQETRIWDSNSYAILGDLRVGRPADWTPNHNRLTIMPGSTVMFSEGRRMDIGGRWSYTTYWGEIYAEVTEDQPILFTPMNDEIGGWNGLVFNSESDDFEGASSSLKHCIFEKANERNLYLGSTYQPGLVEDCIFRQSVQRGVEMIDSRDTLRNCVFEDNQGHSLYYNNAHFVGVLENLTFTGNQYDGVTVNGGHITEDRTWNAYTYYVMENMNVGRHISWDPNHCRLTLMPGTTIKVAQGRRISIAVDDYCGELYAVGTKEQPILFTSINGEVGGWNGMVFPGRSDDYENPSSLLKHCIFEKGNEYNLFITGTTLPEIEDCLFQQSNQFGLRIANEYCQTIKNTVIKDNASHGIYITDNTPFTLGGAPEYACSIYNNGGYGVYQDGYTNIDMSCNFWGNISYKYIDDNFIYDKKDNASKGSITYEPVSWFPMEDFAHVQGTFVYNDTKLMRNREMNVIDAAGEAMATTTTNNNGQFDFSNYQVGVFNTLDTDYGIDILAAVNATDALLTMRHFVHLDTLAYDQAVAADVNGNGSINGTDAMLILRRAIDEEFPLGDFYYYNPNGVIINDDVCTIDLSFICYGDVNGSYSPQNRDNTMTMLSVGQLLADSDQLLDLPVTLKSPAETGALTLRFAYPEAYLEVVDVTLASTGESLLFTADHGELKVVWYSLEPLALAENDGLIIIKARTKDLSDLDEPIAFSLDAYSELANGSAQVLDGVVIAMPVIVTSTLGVHEGAMTEGAHVSTYPNPVNDVCHLTYDLAEAGRVTVSVYNMMGVKVLDVADLHQEEGKHEMEWSTLNLAAGVYNCRVTFEGASSWVKSTVIIIEK